MITSEEYKTALQKNRKGRDDVDLRALEASREYIIKQIDKAIVKHLEGCRGFIYLGSIDTIRKRPNGTIFFNPRIKLDDLNNKWSKLVLPLVKEYMTQLGYIEEGGKYYWRAK